MRFIVIKFSLNHNYNFYTFRSNIYKLNWIHEHSVIIRYIVIVTELVLILCNLICNIDGLMVCGNDITRDVAIGLGSC